MALEITLWGVRGSIPSPHTPSEIEEKVKALLSEYAHSGAGDIEQFLTQVPRFKLGGFGGNTACVQVQSETESLIIDAGSGIRQLGLNALAGPLGQGKGEVHLLFTHFHWDHIIGLPFFVPLFIPGNQIHVYAVQPELEAMFKHVFQKPYFPVPYERLGADIHFHHLEPRQEVRFSDISVTPYRLDHPDPCWGYRCEQNGKVFSYCVDTECTRTNRADLGEDLPLYQGVDVMVFDAQYTFAESVEKIDWGHASAPVGVDLALREGVKKIYFVHHDPSSSDEKVMQAKEQTKAYFETAQKAYQQQNSKVPETKWDFGYEGQVIRL